MRQITYIAFMTVEGKRIVDFGRDCNGCHTYRNISHASVDRLVRTVNDILNYDKHAVVVTNHGWMLYRK